MLIFFSSADATISYNVILCANFKNYLRKLFQNGSLSIELMYANVPLVDRRSCRSWMKEYSYIPKGMICAGYEEGGKDACTVSDSISFTNNQMMIHKTRKHQIAILKKTFPDNVTKDTYKMNTYYSFLKFNQK